MFHRFRCRQETRSSVVYTAGTTVRTSILISTFHRGPSARDCVGHSMVTALTISSTDSPTQLQMLLMANRYLPVRPPVGGSCYHSDVTLIDVEFYGKGSTGRENSDSISHYLHPSLPLDNVRVMVIVLRLRGNIIRTARCWVVWHNVHSPQHTYISSSYRSSRLGLSHWDTYTIHRGGCLELYYCNMVEWSWWDSSLIWKTNWFPSVLWHCWFGRMTCKNRPQNDL